MRLVSFRNLCVATLFATAAVACTSNDAPPTDDEIQSSLELENGGLDTADELPMFGAQAEFAAANLEGDVAADDATTNDPTVADLRDHAAAGARRVMILWGHLPPDRGAPQQVWDGRFALNRGALVVRREVGFEDRTDMLLPRPSTNIVTFASTTKPFVDGLVLEVLDGDASNTAPQTITYTARAGGAPLVFDLAALANGPVSYDVGTDGDRMIATELHADQCDHGFMRGRWNQVRPDMGRMLGVVSDADGSPIGHLRGIWGVRQNGDHVLFAKFIGVDGHFRGIFNGTWGDGQFRGRWVISTGDHGLAQGHYAAGAPGTAVVGGAFVGRWAEAVCAAGL
ncbi:MAG TPA: hypothetical protein VHE35_19610 [Kofleriaceae bacterium]|nr:hypothetical protein [Kofleriaceae bacterium]